MSKQDYIKCITRILMQIDDLELLDIIYKAVHKLYRKSK